MVACAAVPGLLMCFTSVRVRVGCLVSGTFSAWSFGTGVDILYVVYDFYIVTAVDAPHDPREYSYTLEFALGAHPLRHLGVSVSPRIEFDQFS